MSRSWDLDLRPRSRERQRDRRPNRREIPKAMADDGSLQVLLLGLEANRSVVPVVSFGDGRRAKTIQQHAAWMLQLFLGAAGKAETLYDTVKDWQMEDEASDLSLLSRCDGMQVGELNFSGYPPYKAIGASGKHSVMFGLLIHMIMAHEQFAKGFWDELKPYGLASVLQDIVLQLEDVVFRLMSAEDDSDRIPVDANYVPASLQWKGEKGKGNSKARKAALELKDMRSMLTGHDRPDPVTPPLCEGVQMWIVNEDVPVINLPQSGSIFDEHVSWMLQAAMGSEGKAKDLMQYIENYNEDSRIRKTHDECRSKLGLPEQELALVRLTGLGNAVLAVGCAGRRACMLAAVVGIALQDDNYLKDLEPQIGKMYPNLLDPFKDLIRSAIEAQERASGHGGRKARGRTQGRHSDGRSGRRNTSRSRDRHR